MTLNDRLQAALGISASHVLLTVIGVWIGMITGLHTGSGASVPDPYWVAILAGASTFAVMVTIVWIGLLALLQRGSKQLRGQSL